MRGALLPLLWLLLAFLLPACSTTKRQVAFESRRFDFGKDTFAFANELVWVYGYDADGHWRGHRREPEPDYSLHCFVLARSAAQFFNYARFEPDLPVADEATYRQLVRKVVGRSLRRAPKRGETIVIPGYADLRSFSLANEKLLKSECGGYLQSYFQRGNWRMIFPFSRAHQSKTVKQLMALLAQQRVAVVHVVRFPDLSINHAVVVFDARCTGADTVFYTYDPNNPQEVLPLTYDPGTRTFSMPLTRYFPGGQVDIYQVYHRWNY